MLRFNRLLLLRRTRTYFEMWEYHTPLAQVTRLFKMVLLLYMVGHWVSCFFFLMIRYNKARK